MTAEDKPIDWEAAPKADVPELYQNREFSWLDFNDRVLAEADDARNPLLERVRFLTITSSNLDEFYAKRISWLRQLLLTTHGCRTVYGLTIAEQYAADDPRDVTKIRTAAGSSRRLEPRLDSSIWSSIANDRSRSAGRVVDRVVGLECVLGELITVTAPDGS